MRNFNEMFKNNVIYDKHVTFYEKHIFGKIKLTPPPTFLGLSIKYKDYLVQF